MQVVVIRSGIANMESVCAAIRRGGGEPVLTVSPEVAEAADAVVIPGVGAFGTEMNRLREHDLTELLKQRVVQGRKTLGIGLGMQALFNDSAESPGVDGLGIINTSIQKFEAAWPVPQIGWNRVEAADELGVIRSGWGYFAHSYYAAVADDSWRCAMGHHGVPFIAGLEQGPVVACQFHPELSGDYGHDIIKRWLLL